MTSSIGRPNITKFVSHVITQNEISKGYIMGIHWFVYEEHDDWFQYYKLVVSCPYHELNESCHHTPMLNEMLQKGLSWELTNLNMTYTISHLNITNSWGHRTITNLMRYMISQRCQMRFDQKGILWEPTHLNITDTMSDFNITNWMGHLNITSLMSHMITHRNQVRYRKRISWKHMGTHLIMGTHGNTFDKWDIKSVFRGNPLICIRQTQWNFSKSRTDWFISISRAQ